MHVHVVCSDGEAKYWLEPDLSLAKSHGLSAVRLNEIKAIIEEHCNEFKHAWERRRYS